MTVETESLDLFIPAIDDRSEEEIYAKAFDLVAFLSNGILNDRSAGEPLGVLLRAQAFAAAEFLFRCNKLPLALIVQFLSLAGVERSLGAKATASLTFTLTAPRSTPYTIPAGFEVVTSGSSKKFFTKSILVIPPGNLSGTVDAEAEALGGDFNVPAYSLNRITQPLAFLGSVINVEPAQGGAEAEPIEDAINRGMREIRTQNLVSEFDFNEEAERLMGAGSKAKTIGLLGGDKVTTTPGAIHIFCLAPGGEPANIAVLNSVRNGLADRILLGTTLHVSSMDVEEVTVSVYAKISNDITADEVADSLWEAFQSYLEPSIQTPGETLFIEEVRHQLRFVAGVKLIDYILLNDTPNNLDMPEPYSMPVPLAMSLSLADESGNLFELVRGLGDDL
ncbi:baseplate J/gp47 family protein [Leptolyngbya sp. CCNP1308]|uniref:baseplate J/gp47 family protein n=1 Tax=Leptolyngbya sp. CCNP1308 TaxID=3110255 RepID=UPI002B21C497|nr:baseplate J/gp47 family protein [Leptolyngbya sp. CCNP1308]MEA5447575.1 baseplate J/gp47 family protein [Leptolyngbya sp. CCNP1308]